MDADAMPWVLHAVLVLVTTAALFVVLGSWGTVAPTPTTPCMDAETREQVRGIMLAAVDDSLNRHIRNLFRVKSRDRNEPPTHAIAGMASGIEIYMHWRNAIIAWNPPPC